MSAQDGDRTERATPKKRKDARERGQVLKSTEINSSVCLLIMFGFLKIFWNSIVNGTLALSTHFLTDPSVAAETFVFNATSVSRIFSDTLVYLVPFMLPLLLCSMLAALVVNYAQVGFLLSSKALMPKFSRINPLQGFKRIFSFRTLAELVKSIIKVTALGLILYSDLSARMALFPSVMHADIFSTMTSVMGIAFDIGLKLSVVLLIIAVFDYMFQWWQYEKDLRMTKKEVKDEYKLLEGNPQIKQQIKQKQRQMSAMRMMQSVPDADVVITNPTHYAVALQYDGGKHKAPIVLAKGKDFLAQKIKETAKDNYVKITENKPLAQSLYFYCEIGEYISEELYQAVAEILVEIYKTRLPGKGGAR